MLWEREEGGVIKTYADVVFQTSSGSKAEE
jgi:hypothetical protein